MKNTKDTGVCILLLVGYTSTAMFCLMNKTFLLLRLMRICISNNLLRFLLLGNKAFFTLKLPLIITTLQNLLHLLLQDLRLIFRQTEEYLYKLLQEAQRQLVLLIKDHLELFFLKPEVLLHRLYPIFNLDHYLQLICLALLILEHLKPLKPHQEKISATTLVNHNRDSRLQTNQYRLLSLNIQ